MGITFVVFHGNNAVAGLQGVFHDQQPLNDLAGLVLHQHGIAGDIGLALGTVKD